MFAYFKLQIAIQQGALMMERLYSSGLVGAGVSEEEFWESKGLSPNDWPGLAGLMYTDIFSLDFLTPLDDQDTRFKLEVHIYARHIIFYLVRSVSKWIIFSVKWQKNNYEYFNYIFPHLDIL